MRAFTLILFYFLFILNINAGNGTIHPDPETKPSVIKTVVIDPGHGGRDAGCSGHKGKEKDIVLEISKKFGNMITTAFPEVKVIYTRTTDKFVPLIERAEIANRNKADLFISIHVNWHSSSVSGTETYVMGLHSAKENLAVAKRENSSILLEENYKVTYQGYDPNSDEGHIWLTMVQNAYLDQSISLASLIDSEFKKTAQRKSRGIKQAGFVVLRMTTMPSVLIEAGFLSNSSEAAYLLSSHGQTKMAASLFNAFRSYKLDMDGHSALVASAARDKETAKVGKASANASGQHQLTEVIPPTGLSSGVVFRVQLSASRTALDVVSGPLAHVKGLEVVREDGRYKYLVEQMTDFSDAVVIQNYWRKNGFDGAFVVAYKNGVRISVHDARQMAKGS